MKTKKEKIFIRVIPQFTFSPNRISLVAEEAKSGFKKGALVAQVTRERMAKMTRPLQCEIKERVDGSTHIVPVIPKQ